MNLFLFCDPLRRALRAGSQVALSIPFLFVMLALAGCGTTPPDIPAPPIAWTTPAEPLPPVPSCDHHKAERDRIGCRLAYDEETRGQYVRLGERHAALAAWSQRVSQPAKP